MYLLVQLLWGGIFPNKHQLKLILFTTRVFLESTVEGLSLYNWTDFFATILSMHRLRNNILFQLNYYCNWLSTNTIQYSQQKCTLSFLLTGSSSPNSITGSALMSPSVVFDKAELLRHL